MLEDVVRAILADVDPRTPPEDGADRHVWQNLTDSGLSVLLVPESVGGSGASVRELAVVLRGVGAAAASVPISEANLAATVLAGLGADLPGGLLTLTITGDALGRPNPQTGLDAVPYGRAADHVVWVRASDDGHGRVLIVPMTAASIEEGTNLAGEPRDHVGFPVGGVEEVGSIRSVWDLRLQLAACRAWLIVGALERVRDLTVAYAHEREQFGRPLSRFQAVQQLMVETIVVTQVARAITDELADVLASIDEPAEAAPLVAAARATVGRSATVAARCAHQVHGAIGFTMEHPLQASTRRLMAWRDEDGTQADWSRWLGRHVRSSSGPAAPWRLITAWTPDGIAVEAGVGSS